MIVFTAIITTFVDICVLWQNKQKTMDMNRNFYQAPTLEVESYKQPVYSFTFRKDAFVDQYNLYVYADPDNFPISSAKQGSIFSEIFSDLLNDEHIGIFLYYTNGSYEKEVNDIMTHRKNIVSVDCSMNILDAYDHQTMKRPKGNEATYVLTYKECVEVIQRMRFGDESNLFGKEKDDAFKENGGKEINFSLSFFFYNFIRHVDKK